MASEMLLCGTTSSRRRVRSSIGASSRCPRSARPSRLAARLAGDLRRASLVDDVAAHAFGHEPEAERDFVLELGLLDAMAMGGTGGATAGSGGASRRSAELRRAAERLGRLVRPGGTWISVSVVPPSLRVPLLERLARGAFATPPDAGGEAAAAGTGTHVVTLNASSSSSVLSTDLPQQPPHPRLRGAGLEASNVANLLLYGDVDPHIFVYRMRRNEVSSASEVFAVDAGPASALEGIVAAQRPATREDL